MRMVLARSRLPLAASVACQALLGCLDERSASTADLSLAAWPDGRPLSAGQTAVVRGGGTGTVGLWLMHEERCETDVTYNFVPAGTPATLAGQLCSVDGTWYVKLAFSSEQRRRFELTSDNTWLPLGELSAERQPTERPPSKRKVQ